MKIKVNRSLVPIKAHYFFFFAALGPILPQLNVFGRQLGISASAMGLVTAVLPLMWAAAKPLFGYLVDYYTNFRKLIFMLLIILMTGSYCGLWFIPQPEKPSDHTSPIQKYTYKLNDTVYLEKYDNSIENLEKYTCYMSCNSDKNFNIYLTNSTYINTIYMKNDNISCSLIYMESDRVGDKDIVCLPKENCDLLCFEDEKLPQEFNVNGSLVRTVSLDNMDQDFISELNSIDSFKNTNKLNILQDQINTNNTENTVISNATNNLKTTLNSLNTKTDLTKIRNTDHNKNNTKTKVFTKSTVEEKSEENLYVTATFWVFVMLMCVGTVAFNVANCIGDAVCFDVLGPENLPRYGSQRAFGTAGYGITALLGGWLIDLASGQSHFKNFTPAFYIALICTAIDLFSCRALHLPSLTSPEDSGKALRDVLKIPRVLLFIVFAVVAGTFDSFIIYYMFWFLEELAEQTDAMGQIKLIEGIVVAGESFIGEILFFALSGKIITRWGYGATMTFSLLCYGIRMALISCIQQTWHLILIESIMQGPTYALCYSTIVGYAAHVAPDGYSATVQGIVGGMDDGVGFAIGSLLGGQLYSYFGGRTAFRLLATVACVGAVVHAVIFYLLTRNEAKDQPEFPLEEGEKMLPLDSGAIYNDTVVPINGKSHK